MQLREFRQPMPQIHLTNNTEATKEWGGVLCPTLNKKDSFHRVRHRKAHNPTLEKR